MALVYINNSRIDTDAPTAEIVNELMCNGLILQSRTHNVLSNDDVIVRVHNGHVQIDLSNIVSGGKESQYGVTVDSVSIIGHQNFPTSRHISKVGKTVYTCWNTSTGVCVLTQEFRKTCVVDIFQECEIPKLEPAFKYKGRKIKLHDTVPEGLDLERHNDICSDSQLSLATSVTGHIVTTCVHVDDNVKMGCIVDGKVSARQLVTRYKRVAISDTDCISVYGDNADVVAFYVKDDFVTDVVMCGGK